MRRAMHFHPPRFHVHPALGVLDCLVLAAAALALTPLQRVNVVVDDLTTFFIKAAACAAAAAIAWVRVRDSVRRTRETEAKVGTNTEEIARLNRETADARAAAAAAAREVARLADAKAAAAAEIDRLNAEVLRLRDRMHKTNDVVTVLDLERQIRKTTPDPDRSGPLPVIVVADPEHPLTEAPGA